MLIVHIHQEIVLDLEEGGFGAVVFLIYNQVLHLQHAASIGQRLLVPIALKRRGGCLWGGSS